MKKKLFVTALILVAFSALAFSWQGMETPFVVHKWVIEGASSQRVPIRIALLSDLHLMDSSAGLRRLDRILDSVKKESPDLILLAGDYDRKRSPNKDFFNQQVVRRFDAIATEIPVFAVLGNHDNKVGRKKWTALWEQSRVQFIEGRVATLSKKGEALCVRGLGDSFSGYYINEVPFLSCSGLKITVTHDPYAAQINPEGGFYFAGHTHCSQIQLPKVLTFWTPSRAKPDLWCGVSKENDRTVLTSSGLGVSILPLRIGTQAAWDFIEVVPRGKMVSGVNQ